MLNIQQNVSLAPLSSFGIGGNAKFYVEVFSTQDLKEAVKFASEKKINFYVLSGGTNILVSDKGFDGLLIRMKNDEIEINENTVMAGAGASLLKIINQAAEAGLSGLESLAGVPGTLGGAVRGNAGAYGMEISQHIKNITVFDTDTLEEKVFSSKEAKFGYRTSIFKKNKNLIVISASFELQKSDQQELLQKIKDVLSKRNSSGMYSFKSAGSFFMNPEVSDEKLKAEFEKDTGQKLRGNSIPAGWLIDKAGLRGKQIGGAKVSEKHANFIINAGDATSEDVVILASFIKQQVRDKLGVQLQEEVNYVGF